MILIFCSWLYIAFTAINLGIFTERLLKIERNDISLSAIFGLFATTILAGFWAVFARINIEFHVLLLALNLIVFLYQGKIFVWKCLECIREIRKLQPSLKIILTVISILILAQCASAPYAVDNESYYIQTIKWLNEYGLVNGLANLHLYLGQTSGWHIAQSAFSFSFAYDRFNDLSGFCLLSGNIFAVIRLGQYFKNGVKGDLIVGLFPLANVLLFQFIGAPSPDIPIYVLSMMAAGCFFDENDADTLKILSVLVLFAVLIKPTAVPLAVLPIIVFLRNAKVLKAELTATIVLTILVGALYLAKNYIISGYVLFPTAISAGLSPDWQLPFEVADFYYTNTQLYAFRLNEMQFQSMSALSRFHHWLMLPKLHGVFNKLCLILLIISPIVILKKLNNRKYWQLYAVLVLQMMVLAASPQYRFFLNVILLLGFTCLATVIYKRRMIVALLGASTCITAILLLLPVNFDLLTTNRHAIANSTFSAGFIFEPHPNSKKTTEFESCTTGNLSYYSPVNNTLFWGTHDGPLPCVNNKQILHFKSRFHITPQMRTTEIADGFYAKPTER